jgi:hypothetical protein
MDHSGMPPADGNVPLNLATVEKNALRRLTPGRNRWPEIQKLDERVAQLEQRQAAVNAELATLHERQRASPNTDAQRLAQWQLDGQKGPRPEPELPAIEEAISQRQSDVDGLTVAITQVLDEKASFVEKHRERLVQQADQEAEDHHRRVLALIDELAEARSALAEARYKTLWAATFPDASAGQAPPNTLVGARRRPLERAGITSQVTPERVWEVLRADADWLKDASTPAQRAVMEGRDPNRRPTDAVWSGGNGEPPSPEAIAQDRAEKAAALERYRPEWGRYPA